MEMNARLLLAAALSGCAMVGSEDGTKVELSDSGRVELDTGEQDLPDCPLGSVLEIIPLDIWGRDLPTIELSADIHTSTTSELGPGAVWLAIEDDEAIVNLSLDALDHASTTAQVRHRGDGIFELTGLSEGARWAESQRAVAVDGETCEVSTLYIGIDHAWFASTGAAPSNNRATFYLDPEDYWSAVKKELETARRSVSWSTWWWESDFELVRPAGTHVDMPTHERWSNTVLGVMSELDGVDRRILINRFWDDNLDILTTVTADSELMDRAETSGDNFEFMLQGNPVEVPISETYDAEPADFVFGERVLSNERYSDRAVDSAVPVRPTSLSLQVASWHQKAIAIDGRVGFVGGMNTKSTDWDTNQHLLFDSRRAKYEATASERADIEAALAMPDHGPRRDYGIRVEGPAARDLDDIFASRWQQGIAEDDMFSEYATPMTLRSAVDAPSGAVPTQVTVTMPPPWNQMSTWEGHAKAIRSAERFIFIEDQYFRAPVILDEIIARMNAQPDLLLTVITRDLIGLDPGKKYTYQADESLRSLFPDRYQMFELHAVALTIEEGWFSDDVVFYTQVIDTHSKLRIIDDRYLSVGSTNFNNRGYKYEGEVNISVLDEATVTDARRSMMANLVGPRWAEHLSDDAQNNFDVMGMAATDNQLLSAYWQTNAELMTGEEAVEGWPDFQPSGFIYPLEIRNDWEWDIGPDIF
jgi:phosphatidylserine/phosphatidylglycerophosphate/cardiolipin synthase-like enzyme